MGLLRRSRSECHAVIGAAFDVMKPCRHGADLMHCTAVKGVASEPRERADIAVDLRHKFYFFAKIVKLFLSSLSLSKCFSAPSRGPGLLDSLF